LFSYIFPSKLKKLSFLELFSYNIVKIFEKFVKYSILSDRVVYKWTGNQINSTLAIVNYNNTLNEISTMLNDCLYNDAEEVTCMKILAVW
jgi:hypothetical protein